MKRVLISLALVLVPALCSAQTTQTVAVASAPPFLVTLLIFFAACACVVFGFQVFTLVKGGQLSKSWLLFTSGFAVFAISQLLVLLSGFGVIEHSRYLVPVALVLMSGLFFYGLWMTKRTLG